MHGYWEWYRQSGTLMRSGHFENDQQCGEWTTYDQQGKPFKVTLIKPKAKRTAA
jgi:antitoxin component YwqK of YwqJK toxin-antitoxin module